MSTRGRRGWGRRGFFCGLLEWPPTSWGAVAVCFGFKPLIWGLASISYKVRCITTSIHGRGPFTIADFHCICGCSPRRSSKFSLVKKFERTPSSQRDDDVGCLRAGKSTMLQPVKHVSLSTSLLIAIMFWYALCNTVHCVTLNSCLDAIYVCSENHWSFVPQQKLWVKLTTGTCKASTTGPV